MALPSTVGLVTFEFHGTSMKTRPDGMVYRYRLSGHDEEWQTTGEQYADYEEIPTGRYTFEVVAIDRDLVYSEKPATLRLAVPLAIRHLHPLVGPAGRVGAGRLADGARRSA